MNISLIKNKTHSACVGECVCALCVISTHAVIGYLLRWAMYWVCEENDIISVAVYGLMSIFNYLLYYLPDGNGTGLRWLKKVMFDWTLGKMAMTFALRRVLAAMAQTRWELLTRIGECVHLLSMAMSNRIHVILKSIRMTCIGVAERWHSASRQLNSMRIAKWKRASFDRISLRIVFEMGRKWQWVCHWEEQREQEKGWM